jgi:hypothetical protein
MNLTYLTMAIFAATTKCTAVVSASSIATATTSDVSDAAWNDEVTQGDYEINHNYRELLATRDNLATSNPLEEVTGDNKSFIEFLQDLIFKSTGNFVSDAAAKAALCYTPAQLTTMATASCANVTAYGGECTGTVESYSCVAKKVTRRRQLFRAAGSRDLQTTATYEVTNEVDIMSKVTLYVSGNTDVDLITALEATLKGQIVASTTVATQTLTATCPTAPPGVTCAAPTITIKVVNPAAKDLTRWYPEGWSEEGKFCSNNGGYAPYMLKNGFLMSSLEACCKRYHGWQTEKCLVAGGKPQAESGHFYVNYQTDSCNQDCLKTGSSLGAACTNPGEELPQTWQTKYKDATTCCKNKLWWLDEPTCIAKSGDPNASVTYVGSNKYYVVKDGSDCVQDCATSNGSQCVQPEGTYQPKYDTLDKCCTQHFHWLEEDRDNCKTARYYNTP